MVAYRRSGDKFDPIQIAADGSLACQSLGVDLLPRANDLVLRDNTFGNELLTEPIKQHLFCKLFLTSFSSGSFS